MSSPKCLKFKGKLYGSVTFIIMCIAAVLSFAPQMTFAQDKGGTTMDDANPNDSTEDEKIAHVMVHNLTAEPDTIGWPAHYSGVMLQGFYWNSYDETKWTNLTANADSVSKYFDLIWVPNAGRMAGKGTTPSMGYLHYYWYNLNTATFGTETELRDMISAYRKNGTGIIEDVVFNHQCPVNDMEPFYFPEDTLDMGDGSQKIPHRLTSEDVLTDDNGGSTLKEALLRGKKLSPFGGEEALPRDVADDAANPVTESNPAGLDLDHRSKNVREMARDLTKMYLKKFGFAGFRYDVAAGYRPEHLVDYNYYSKPRFSIGEVWKQDSMKVNWWLKHWTYEDTNKKSHQICATFDFPLKYHIINAAFGGNDFSQKTDIFKNKEIINTPNRSRYSVTFTENHDTYWPRVDRSNDDSGPGNYLKSNVLAANAYILAMPGTPCIFLTHYLDTIMRPEIKKMIMARKAAGVTNTSRIIDDGYDPTDLDGYYCVTQGETPFTHTVKETTIDKDGNITTTEKTVTDSATILFFAGNVNPINLNGHSINDYTLISEGENYKFYISNFAVPTYEKYYKDGLADTDYKALKEKINSSAHDNDPIVDGDKANHNPVYAPMLPKRTVFVEQNKNIKKAPILYVWGSDGKITNYEPLGIWDVPKFMTNDTIVNGTKYWYMSFYVNDGYNVILHNGEENDVKYKDINNGHKEQFEKLSGDVYFRLNANDMTGEDITESVLHAGNVRRYTIYVRKDADNQTAPHLYIKDSDNREINGIWKNGVPTETTTLNGKTYWYHTVSLTSTQTYSVTLHNAAADSAKVEGTTVNALTSDIYFSWDEANDTAINITNDIIGYAGHNYTVYVEVPEGFNTTTGKVPRLHAWEEGGITLTAGWEDDAQKMTQTTTMNGKTYWYKTFNVNKEGYHVILHLLQKKDGVSADTQVQFDGIKSNVYLSWNPEDLTKCANITSDVTGQVYNLYTVFVRKDAGVTAPALHAWDASGNLNGEWGAQKPMDQEITLSGTTWWYKTLKVKAGSTYNVILHKVPEPAEGNPKQTDDIKNLSGDVYLTWDGTSTASKDKLAYTDITKETTTNGDKKIYYIFVRKTAENKDVVPKVHAWGDEGNFFGDWTSDTQLMNNEDTCVFNDYTYWYKKLETKGQYYLILHTKDKLADKDKQTDNQGPFSTNAFYTWNPLDPTKCVNLTSNVLFSGNSNYTVYVKKSSDKAVAPKAYIKRTSDDKELNGAYDSQTALSDETTRNGFTWWYKTFDVPQGDSYSVQLHSDGTKETAGAEYTKLGHDVYLTWNDADHTSTDTTLYITGAWKKYTVYVRQTNDTAKAPALHVWLSDSQQTPLNGGWSDQLKNLMSATTTINGMTYWYKTFLMPAEDKYNVILHNAKGQGEAYTDLQADIYLLWDDATHSSSNLTVSVNGQGGEGAEEFDETKPYVQRMYTVYVKNDYGWKIDKDHTVHAFVWNSSLAPQYNYSGAWPGQTMTKVTLEDGKEYFAWSYIGTQTQQPEKVIFNYWDGTSKRKSGESADKPYVVQTADLEFHDGAVYELTEGQLDNNNPDWKAYTEKTHYDATDSIKAAYKKAYFGTSHVVFFEDRDNLGWNNLSVSVWRETGGKTTVDYAGGHNTAEGSETGGQRMTPIIIKNQRYYVWNYSGDNDTIPTKIMFHNDAPAKTSGTYDYVEGGLYILKEDGVTLEEAKPAPELVAMNSLYQRTFTPGTYSTICLPFTITEADMMKLGIKVFSFRRAENNMLTFVRTTDNTKMLCPYLVLYEPASDEANPQPKNIFYADQFAINTEYADTAAIKTATPEEGATWANGAYDLKVGDWTFHGNATVSTIVKSNDATTAYFGYNAADNTFTWVENGRASIAPTACWFSVAKDKLGEGKGVGTEGVNTSAKRMGVRILEYDDTPTGISTVRNESGVRNEELGVRSYPMYNLSGQRVDSSYKGIVIQHGRKIIRR